MLLAEFVFRLFVVFEQLTALMLRKLLLKDVVGVPVVSFTARLTLVTAVRLLRLATLLLRAMELLLD
jgi:hypothetical protein